MNTVLFISRKYPPVIGGMENYAYYLHHEFNKHHQVHDIILKKNQWHLLWFYPWIYIRGLYLLLSKKIDVIYVGDGVLSSAAWFFQTVLRKKVILTIHGLDVIYKQSLYQKMIRLFLPKIKSIVANSQATKKAAIDRGVPKNQITVIPVGVNWEECDIDVRNAKKELSAELGVNLDNKTILFTIGRLVERKGVYWFVKNVMPALSDDYVYLIAGSGPDEQFVKDIIHQKNLSNRVFILGRVDDSKKSELFTISDIFISPNIETEGDMEGFGIVNLEAGTFGLPVVATKTDGVVDAIKHNITGFLVEPNNCQAMIKGIEKSNRLCGSKIKSYVRSHFKWSTIYENYKSLF